ncbi:unnamed protein product, partial [marine sediment metagenome]
DDSPLSGALVTINDSVKTTDESGRVDFYNLDPGTMPVQIERDGYVNFASDDQSVRNDTSISIRLTPVSRSLTMYISNSYSGLPIENASISIDGNSIVSDQNGRAIYSIYSGFYPVHISHERYAEKALSISISKDTVSSARSSDRFSIL